MLAMVFGIWTGATQAQSENSRERVETGPRTLLEALLGSGAAKEPPSGEEERLDPDRPHFPEASTAVGNGRVMLESGYTFSSKGAAFAAHAFPEALMRVGMFAEWFEFRVGQSFLQQRETLAGVTTTKSGFQDFYLGAKLALMEQHDWLPAVALIPQMTVPTGARAVTGGRALPGVNTDFSWDIVKDFFGVELLVASNRVQDDVRGSRFELATGLTGTFQLTKRLESFIEWDAFYPTGGISPAAPRHYAVGGLVYFISPNLAVDARVGVGLNHSSNDFVAGLGFAVRR
jgi:Putative MetA-pathway of phenol degradation